MNTQENKMSAAGGPAFPMAGQPWIDREGRPLDPHDGHGWMTVPQDGMTLRDYFAAKAMQGAISTFSSYGDWFPGEVAELAYKQADAMLAARGDV